MTDDAFHFHPAPTEGAGDLGPVLQATLPLLTRLMEAVPARVVVLDAKEHLVWANQEFFRFTGLHPKQVLHQPIARIVGDKADSAYAKVRNRIRSGETVAREGWIELAGAGRRYMREHLVPVAIHDGLPQATIFISLDVTELKLRDAELSTKVQALEATQALKSSIFDNAMAALVSTDQTGHVVEFNPAASAMFGLAREQALGRSVAEVMIPPRLRAAHQAGMARVTAGGEQRVMGKRVRGETPPPAAVAAHALRHWRHALADGPTVPAGSALRQPGQALFQTGAAGRVTALLAT